MATDDKKPEYGTEAPNKGPDPARARKPRKKRSRPPQKHGGTVEARIVHIVGLMRALKFQTGKTGPQLAAKWKLSPKTVEEHTSEASRRVCASVMRDRDRIGATVGAALEKAILAASAAGDHRVIAQLADTWAKISGVSAATRHEHAGKDGGPIVHIDMSGLNDEQIDRVLAGHAPATEGTGGGGEGSTGE
jgi:hypothetical protein